MPDVETQGSICWCRSSIRNPQQWVYWVWFTLDCRFWFAPVTVYEILQSGFVVYLIEIFHARNCVDYSNIHQHSKSNEVEYATNKPRMQHLYASIDAFTSLAPILQLLIVFWYSCIQFRINKWNSIKIETWGFRIGIADSSQSSQSRYCSNLRYGYSSAERQGLHWAATLGGIGSEGWNQILSWEAQSFISRLQRINFPC